MGKNLIQRAIDAIKGERLVKRSRYSVAFARFGKVVVEAPTSRIALDRASLALEDKDLGLPTVISCSKLAEPGTRVRVVSGDTKADLGTGTYIGEVDIYLLRDKEGRSFIPEDPEKMIPDDVLIKNHLSLARMERTPKIKLDSGEMVYGCSVWWAPEGESPEEESIEEILGDSGAN